MVERIFLLTEIITIAYCLFALYGQKFRFDICTVVLIALDIICLEALNEGLVNEIARVVIYIAVFVYCLLEFKSSIKQAIVNNFLYIIIVSVIQLVCSMPFIAFGNVMDNSELIIVSVNLVTFVIVSILTKVVSFKKISDYTTSKDWLTVILIVLYFVLIMYSIQKYRTEDRMMTEYYMLLVGFIVLTIAFMMKWQESRSKIMRQKLELEMYEVYNNTFEELLHNIRRKQHDYKNQINAIYSQQYTSKTYEEFIAKQKDYLAYINRENELDHLLAVNIPIIGGFLYSKFSTWKNEGINVSYQIQSKAKKMGVPVYEVITILGILLDNAYDAVEGYSKMDKNIKFVMNEKRENIVFQVKNPANYISFDEISQFFKEGHSSKGKGRGIGLYNAKNKASKYDMNLIVTNEEINGQNWICFTLEVKMEQACELV